MNRGGRSGRGGIPPLRAKRACDERNAAEVGLIAIVWSISTLFNFNTPAFETSASTASSAVKNDSANRTSLVG